MLKKTCTYIFLLFIVIFLTACTIKNKTQPENNLQSKAEASTNNDTSNDINTELESDYSKFTGFDMSKDDVNLKIDGKLLDFTLPIYLNKNRYYFPLNEIIYDTNGKGEKSNNSLYITINNVNYSINLSDNTVKCPNRKFSLKEKLLTKDNIYYIGFSDLSNMLDLYTRWDKDKKIIICKTNSDNVAHKTSINTEKNINITNNKELFININSSQDNSINTNNLNYVQNNTQNNSKNVQIGLIRLEDICLTSMSYDKNYFENLRVIGMYLNQKNIPYHIAWIPRYVNPKLNIDNDPLTKNNFELGEMVYTLDYLKTHNGTIGLHGYTHQFGNHESAIGFEFGKYEPSEAIFREKIRKAIETAKYLNIPIDFFEVPHYEITSKQNKIAEEYFKILYYPFKDYGLDKIDLTKPQLSSYNKSSYYISTPLDYLPEGKEDAALERIKNADIKNMGSVFYHPRLEDKFISLIEDSNGLPTFKYEDSSTLKKLISILEEKGFKMIKVTDIK
ncbi:polysaccharide deacetylase family protein [Clostridium sp. CTA-5]